MHHISVLLPFLLAFVVDVIIELTREGVLSEMLNLDDLIMMSEIIKEI